MIMMIMMTMMLMLILMMINNNVDDDNNNNVDGDDEEEDDEKKEKNDEDCKDYAAADHDDDDVVNSDIYACILKSYNFFHPSQFIIPGFVDSHAHAPQYTFMGTGGDLPLIPWLQTYTYPTETLLNTDDSFARDVYEKCVVSLIFFFLKDPF